MRTFAVTLGRLFLSHRVDNSVGEVLLRGAGGTVALRFGCAAVSFLINVLLARALDPSGYGAYTYALAVVGLLSVLGVFGMDQLLIRNVAAYRARAEWSAMKGLLLRTVQAALLLSAALVLLAGLTLRMWDAGLERETARTLLLGLALLPVVVLARLRQAIMQGLHSVLSGQLPDLLIQPVLFLLSLGAAYWLLAGQLTAFPAMALNLGASIGALAIGARLLCRVLPSQVGRTTASYDTAHWLRTAVPMLLMSSCFVINSRADVLMLGALRGSAAVGIYSAAARGAELISFFLGALNVGLAPTISHLFAQGDMKQMQRLITQGARAVSLLSLPIAAILLVFGKSFLLLFGSAFTEGYGALVLLSAGQMINVTMGSVGLLLTMTGHERDAAVIVGIAATANVAGNLLLIPRWGMEGAATATLLSGMLWNLCMARQVARRTGIHPTALGVIGPRRRTP